MRVLIVFHGTPPLGAGADTMARKTAAALAGCGHEVAVATVAGGKRPGEVTVAEQTPEGLARAVPWVPQVVHTFDLVHPAIGRAAADLAERVGAVHAVTPASAPATWLDQPVGMSVARAADVVFALTAVEADILVQAGVARDRIRLAPQGADLADRPATARHAGLPGLPPPGPPVVLYLGRKVAFKGYRLLLAAGPLIWSSVPDARLVFAGPSVDADVESVFAGFSDDRVIDLGYVDDHAKPALVDRSDIVCLPSAADVFPLVFAEAWACGKPVVTGRFDGAEGVVRHGVDGLVVDLNPAAVADAVVHLLRHPAERRRLGRNGRRRFDRHLSWDAVAALVQSGYRDAAGLEPSRLTDLVPTTS